MSQRKIAFRRKYEELRDFELAALAVVREVNGDFYQDGDYEALRVSAQWLQCEPNQNVETLAVIFRMKSDAYESPYFAEIALALDDGSFAYGGYLVAENEVFINLGECVNAYRTLDTSVVDSETGDILRLKYVFNGFVYTLLTISQYEMSTWGKGNPWEEQFAKFLSTQG